MSDRELELLEEENRRLQKLADYDELTNVYNRRAAERLVSEQMQPGNAFFVCDLDYFKNVNDVYGHLKGDVCLKETASLLTYIMRGRDIVGRIGGDEFIVYAVGSQTPDTVEIIRKKITNRFESYNEKAEIPLHLSIGASICREDDTYQSMFDRADQELLKIKTEKHAGRSGQLSDNWIHDLTQIQKELDEQISMPIGAYCQDYESFKVIYRFLERSMRRHRQKASVLLFSIVDSHARSLLPEEKLVLMDMLGNVIRNNLRLGDVYARYSSCQYLVLLDDAPEKSTTGIAERIRQRFLEGQEDKFPGDILVHHSYQLEPAKIEDQV